MTAMKSEDSTETNGLGDTQLNHISRLPTTNYLTTAQCGTNILSLDE